MKTKEEVPTIDGLQSFSECRKNIKRLAINISNDISNTAVNTNRALSIRSLLELFERYNEKLIAKEDKNGRN